MSKTMDDRIKDNKKYIDIAYRLGIISSSDVESYEEQDYLLINWIDELDKAMFDINKFKTEVLPSFKCWLENGVNTTGVGRIYSVLKLAEVKGLEIKSGFVSCVLSLLSGRFNKLTDVYSVNLNFFEIDEMLNNLKRFNQLGIPFLSNFFFYYDELLELDNKGEKVDLGTALFFLDVDTRKNHRKRMRYWHERDVYKDYIASSAGEVTRLHNIVCMKFGSVWGANLPLIEEYKEGIEERKDSLVRNKNELLRSLENYKRVIGKSMMVKWYNSFEERKIDKFVGKLIGCDNGVIKLESKSGEVFTLDCNDESKLVTIIEQVGFFNSTIPYEIPMQVIRDWRYVEKNKKEIEKLSQIDVVSKYYEKFGTLAGLGYLKRWLSSFIEVVDPKRFPINNLFAFCFETIGCSKDNPEESLKQIWYAYNEISKKRNEVLINYASYFNFGFHLEDIIIEGNFDDVCQTEFYRRICYAAMSNKCEEELPPESSRQVSSQGSKGSLKSSFVYNSKTEEEFKLLAGLIYETLISGISKDLLETVTFEETFELIIGLLSELGANERNKLKSDMPTELLNKIRQQLIERMKDRNGENSYKGRGMV